MDYSAEQTRLSKLMQKAQSGDQRAYQELLESSAQILRESLVNRIPESDRELAVQKTLRLLHRARHTYHPKKAYFHWLGDLASQFVDTKSVAFSFLKPVTA